MHTLTEIAVVVGLRLDKAVERVGHLGVAHQDSPHGAYARRLLVGCLKVDGNKIPEHSSLRLAW